MDAWKPLLAFVIMFGSILWVAWWAGHKDKQYLEGKLDKPVPQWWLMVLTITPFVILFCLKYFNLWHWIE